MVSVIDGLRIGGYNLEEVAYVRFGPLSSGGRLLGRLLQPIFNFLLVFLLPVQIREPS